MALTAKQQRFVAEYLIDLNATQAAIRAGYSKGTADKQGPRLLSNPDVKASINAAKVKRSERTEIDADWMLRRLVEEAEADLADLYDSNGDLKPIDDWPEIWRQGLVSGVEVDALFEGSGEARRQVGYVKKIKLSDRVRRLEMIGRHIKVNAFQENINHTGLDALGDRLERATVRARAAEIEAARALPTPPGPRPADAASTPIARPAEQSASAAPSSPPSSPSPSPPAPKPYRPIMPPASEAPWPSFGGFAATDYDPST